MDKGLWAWIGYREEWDHERTSGSARRFSFRAAGVTVYFGRKNDVYKPQILRAEWAGWAKWSGSDYDFQGEDAGHPHWQFDAMESLSDVRVNDRVATLRKVISDGDDENVVEFSPQLDSTDAENVIAAKKYSRLHLASAAAWWKSAPHNLHAHCPDKLSDVESWLRHSITYLSGELRRL